MMSNILFSNDMVNNSNVSFDFYNRIYVPLFNPNMAAFGNACCGLDHLNRETFLFSFISALSDTIRHYVITVLPESYTKTKVELEYI